MRSLREIAILEEGRQARAIADVADAYAEIAGGFMCRGEPGTWCNTAVGLGLVGPVTEDEVDRLVAWFVDHGREPNIELCPFADDTLRRSLARRGFVLRIFENCFFRELSVGDEFKPRHGQPTDIEIRRIDPHDPTAVREYGMAVATGFSDKPPRESDIDLMARCATHERSIAFGAYHAGRCIAGGAVEVCGEVAALFGLSVLPDFRRRGIQQALIATRLQLALSHGATIATISSRPGVPTEGNVRRMGFQVAYTKAVLTRPGVGLAPVHEL